MRRWTACPRRPAGRTRAPGRTPRPRRPRRAPCRPGRGGPRAGGEPTPSGPSESGTDETVLVCQVGRRSGSLMYSKTVAGDRSSWVSMVKSIMGRVLTRFHRRQRPSGAYDGPVLREDAGEERAGEQADRGDRLDAVHDHDAGDAERDQRTSGERRAVGDLCSGEGSGPGAASRHCSNRPSSPESACVVRRSSSSTSPTRGQQPGGDAGQCLPRRVEDGEHEQRATRDTGRTPVRSHVATTRRPPPSPETARRRRHGRSTTPSSARSRPRRSFRPSGARSAAP